MKAYLFPGQASQFEGMGKDLYESSDLAKNLFEQANEILGYRITDVMFDGTMEDLKQTKITQPAVFLHSIVKATLAGTAFQPDAVAGHSLGEFSALVAAQAMSFEDGLRLVYQRAMAMQKACEAVESTMAAILGLEDEIVEKICAEIKEAVVVPANYNCPGQLVISGSIKGIEIAVAKLTAAGAKRAVMLEVGGAFHSPLMQPAQDELAAAIANTPIHEPICPIYQNVNALPQRDPAAIKQNLIEQLTAPVRWTQTVVNMLQDGITAFIEVGGTGKVLQSFVKKVDRNADTSSL
ncbi:MAG TPA: [acyl-carrier-protein] S-malonyltransferase [Alphaproteobacteria bacterium]|nr:[acyl-carrier-protein] S-malonyltransferase [Alphaproteobacteria bacterium]